VQTPTLVMSVISGRDFRGDPVPALGNWRPEKGYDLPSHPAWLEVLTIDSHSSALFDTAECHHSHWPHFPYWLCTFAWGAPLGWVTLTHLRILRKACPFILSSCQNPRRKACPFILSSCQNPRLWD
jgi:hypothetical protein